MFRIPLIKIKKESRVLFGLAKYHKNNKSSNFFYTSSQKSMTELCDEAIEKYRKSNASSIRPILTRDYRNIEVSNSPAFNRVLSTPGVYAEIFASGVGDYTRTLIYHSKDGDLFLVFMNPLIPKIHLMLREISHSKLREDISLNTK